MKKSHFTPAFLKAWADVKVLLEEDGIDKDGKASVRTRELFRQRMLELGHIERIRNLYRIQHKLDQKAVFFQPNGPQEDYLKTRKGRDTILKIRQVGFTTMSGVRGFDYAAWEPNMRTGIMAHKQNTVETIFQDIVKFTYDWFQKDWGHLYGLIEHSDSKSGLLFKQDDLGRSLNSSMRVMFDFQGKTIHFLHVSEAAFIDNKRLSNSLQGVPATGEVILESTANGRGGEFHRQWQNWKRMKELAPYKGHFIPWFIFYPERPADWTLPEGTVLTAYERSLIDSYQPYISEPQIAWRRWCIEANCEGDAEVFENQYPTNDVDCFLANGAGVFPALLLRAIEKKVRPPTSVGFLLVDGMRTVFQEDQKGLVQIWDEPDPSAQYVIGADPSAGIGKDSGAIVVKNRDNKRVVAMIKAQLTPDEYTNELYKLATFYNKAWICPEENNHGHVVIQLLKQKLYPNIYKRQVIDEMSNKPTQKVGFQTTNDSKIRITEQVKISLKRGDLIVMQEDILNEMTTYIQISSKNNRTVKREASEGCHDDLVMALALAEEMDAVRGKIVEDEMDTARDYDEPAIDDETGFAVA